MLKDDIMAVKNEMENLKQDLKSDSNSVYMLTKEKNKYFIILMTIFVVFISFLLFNSFYLYGKIDSINSKLDSMINAEDEYQDYEKNIEIDTGDGGNANYVEGNNNSINN